MKNKEKIYTNKAFKVYALCTKHTILSKEIAEDIQSYFTNYFAEKTVIKHKLYNYKNKKYIEFVDRTRQKIYKLKNLKQNIINKNQNVDYDKKSNNLLSCYMWLIKKITEQIILTFNTVCSCIEVKKNSSKIQSKMEEHYNYHKDTVLYIIKTPLLFNTVTCASMIEEVGFAYLNMKYDWKDKNQHFNSKNVITELNNKEPDILKKLFNENDFEQISIKDLKKLQKDTRDDISHTITKITNISNEKVYKLSDTYLASCYLCHRLRSHQLEIIFNTFVEKRNNKIDELDLQDFNKDVYID